MNLDGLILNKNKFTKMIEETVHTKHISYLDAIVWLCEKHNIEIEDVKKYISPVVVNKLEAEARDLNFIQKLNKLPFE